MRRAWCWFCFRLYLIVPHRWQFTDAALWLLGYAGEYAYGEPAP